MTDVALGDRRLAVELQNLMDRRIDLAIRGRLTGHRYGVVFGAADTVHRTVPVRLYGLPNPSPGFHYGSGLAPRDGDHVRVYIDPRGDKWIDDILGRDVVSEIVDVVTPPVIQPDRARGAIARILVAPSSDHYYSGSFDIRGDEGSGGADAGALFYAGTTYTYHAVWTSDGTINTREFALTFAYPPPVSYGIGYSAVSGMVNSRVQVSDFDASPVITLDGTFTTADGAHMQDGGIYRMAATAASVPHSHHIAGSLVFWVDPDGWVTPTERFVPAPQIVDGDDATYQLEVISELEEAVRIDLGGAYRIIRARIVIGTCDPGEKTYTLRAANEGDFSDEVTVATMTFTSAGDFDPVTLTPVWPSTTPYRFWRLVGPAEERRIYTVELYETTAGETPVVDPTTGDGSLIDAALAALAASIITSHPDLTDRDVADQHPADAVSYDPTASGLTATDAQAAIDELAAGGSAPATLIVPLTNKSGASVAAGDVVVLSAANADAFTTTTVAQATFPIGVAQAAIANNAIGLVAIAGYVASVNTNGSTFGLRTYLETNGSAKQATANPTRRQGSFGVILGTGANPDAILFGATDQTPADYAPGGTDVAVADGGTGASTASGARTNLGLVIATDVEAHDPDLTTIAGLSPSNDDVIQRKSGAWTNRTMAQLAADLGGGSGTLTTVEEVDGSPTDSAVTKLVFPNGTLAIVGHVATYTPAGAGGPVSWTLVVDESGASFANWTNIIGTWASDGTNIQQTAVSTTFKSAQLTAQTPFGFGPVIAECEVRFPTAGQGTGTFVHGGIVVGAIGILLNEGTTKQLHWQNYGVTDYRTLVTTIALDTWYKIRVVLAGNTATVYKDGVLIGTTYTPSAIAFDYLYLGSYNSKVDFRNIKVWLLTGGTPA